MSEPFVTFNGLSRTFVAGDGAANTVLEKASGVIDPGARIVLSGPSGSGKSTLLNILGGLDAPSDGDISWPALGRISDLRPRQLAFVFQSPSLFPALDVLNNVCLPAMLAGAQDARTRAEALLRDLGLEEVARKFPDDLSGGQAQRVAIARALILSPRLVLADEPTGQLDGDTAGRVIDVILAALEKTDAALLVATHDPAVAARFATHWSIAHGHLNAS